MTIGRRKNWIDCERNTWTFEARKKERNTHKEKDLSKNKLRKLLSVFKILIYHHLNNKCKEWKQFFGKWKKNFWWETFGGQKFWLFFLSKSFFLFRWDVSSDRPFSENYKSLFAVFSFHWKSQSDKTNKKKHFCEQL